MSNKVAVVMAAGQGTRMKSDLPKVLVPVCGRPMIDYVLDALLEGGIERIIVVVGYRSEDVRAALSGREGLEFAYQEEQLGTGHAVMSAREALTAHEGPVMVIAGDGPMMQSVSVARLLTEYEETGSACVLGTIYTDDPTGLGRIVRDGHGEFQAIVEEKDATDEQRRISEVNMSYYVFHCPDLLTALESLRCDNAQSEYYITDAPGLLKAAGKQVQALPVLQPCEAMGDEYVAGIGGRGGEDGGMNDMKVFSGRGNPELAKRMCDYLGLSLGRLSMGNFPDGEISCKIDQDVRGRDVFLVLVHLPTGQRDDHGALDHDRLFSPGQRGPDHGGNTIFRIRAAGPQG